MTDIDPQDKRAVFSWALSSFENFCGFLYIIPKHTGVRQPFEFNPIQKLLVANKTDWDVVLKARQVGLSTVACAQDIYHFLTRPSAKVVVTCQSFEDHGPMKTIANMMRVMMDGLADAGLNTGIRQQTMGEWILPGRDASLTVLEAGASEAAAKKKGRSGNTSRLHMSEVAFYEYAGRTFEALLPGMVDRQHGGELIVESTPNGNSGKFFELCMAARSGESGHKFHFYPWFLEPKYRMPAEPDEVFDPRTSREQYLVSLGLDVGQLKWYRAKVHESGQAYMDQEFASDPETCFLSSGRTFFDRQVLADIRNRCVAPKRVKTKGMLRIWHEPVPGHDYVIGVDTAEGVGNPDEVKGENYHGGKDNSAAVVYERGTGRHVATLWGQLRPWDLAGELCLLGALYNTATIAVERNNHGHAAIRALEAEQRYPKIYRDRDGKLGWLTTQQSRVDALDHLEDAIRKGEWVTQDANIIGEMINFTVNERGKAEAAKGAHDDLVIAAAVGWSVLRRPKNFRFDSGSGY